MECIWSIIQVVQIDRYPSGWMDRWAIIPGWYSRMSDYKRELSTCIIKFNGSVYIKIHTGFPREIFKSLQIKLKQSIFKSIKPFIKVFHTQNKIRKYFINRFIKTFLESFRKTTKSQLWMTVRLDYVLFIEKLRYL